MSRKNQSDAEPTDGAKAVRQSTVEPSVQSRDARLFLLLSLAFTLYLFYAPPSLLKYSGLALGLLSVVVFGICVFVPSRCQRGVILFDGGFEQFDGLRGSQTIHFPDIESIMAVQTGGGGEGDEVLLEICNRNGTIRLRERDLFGTDLHHILFDLPGFQHGQYSAAANYRLKGLENFKCKRFLVFEKT